MVRVPTAPAVITVAGWHASESLEDIFRRKRRDITISGYTIWMYQSWLAATQSVQTFGDHCSKPAVYFLRGTAKPTTSSSAARQYSQNAIQWKSLDQRLGKVTGKLPGGGLVLDELAIVDNYEVDLWEYQEHFGKKPLKFQLGASTACALPADVPAPGMKSRFRQVAAIGRLAPPYAVFLR
jgi:hypothetical protein